MEEAALHQKAMTNTQQLMDTIDLGKYIESGEVVAKQSKDAPHRGGQKTGGSE